MKSKNVSKQDQLYRQASLGFQEGVARICRLYGVSPLLGRLFAILFLATEPLALEDLCRRTGAAKSSVSVALRKLLALRVVQRLPSGSDRRDFYEAVTDPWTIFEDWTRIYVRPEVEMWRNTGTALEHALGSARDAPKGPHRTEVRARLAAMFGFLEVFERFVGTVSGTRATRESARSIPIQIDEVSK